MVRALLMLSLLVAAASPAAAKTPSPSASPLWSMTAKGGVSIFTGSNSKAAAHFVHPVMRLEGAYRVSPRLEIGAELGAVVAGSANYAFESASLVMRTPLYEGEIFSMRLGWGFGIGSGPPILSDDLKAQSTVVPTMQVSLGFRWEVVCDSVDIGLEIIDEQLTVLSAVLTAGVKL